MSYRHETSSPAISVPLSASVQDAVRTLVRHRIGAVVVLDGDRVAGIFSERDVLDKVVLARRDPAATPVGDVMTSPVVTAPARGADVDPLDTMVEHHIRHLPVVDDEKHVVGMLSLRRSMKERIEDLRHEVAALEAYLGYDGVSG